MESCEKYQTQGCESCQWRNSLKHCLGEIVDEYNCGVEDRSLELQVIDRELYLGMVELMVALDKIKR